MQAFANNVTENMDSSEEAKNNSFTSLDTSAPLFPTDEFIFPDENSERTFTRYGYKISSMNFLIPEGTISEVIQSPNIFDLPNTPVWIEGLINIRGNIIPVMNINNFLNNSIASSNIKKVANILVLNKTDDNSTIAIIIDDLPISLESDESKSIPFNYPDKLQDYIENGINSNSINWLEFDPQKLFKKLANKAND